MIKYLYCFLVGVIEMKAPDFSYFEAQNIEDAIKYKSADDEAFILAGGQSLLPALNMTL